MKDQWEIESEEVKNEMKKLDERMDEIIKLDRSERQYLRINDLRKKWEEIDEKFDKINDLYIEDLSDWVREINFYLSFSKKKLELKTWCGKVNIRVRSLTLEEEQKIIADLRDQ